MLLSLCVGFVLLSAAPARADIVYTVDTGFTGLAGSATVAGHITTDGTVGILEPQNILDCLGWWRRRQKTGAR